MSQVWTAELRTEEGKGASRRLRHAGKIPAIIYGGDKEAKSIALVSNLVERALQDNDYFNMVLTIEGAGDTESCVIKDLQRHPATGFISHIDFQRASDTAYIVKRVPLAFKGKEVSPGVKMGGLMSFMQQSVEVRCLTKDLPTKIEVDVSNMEAGTNLRLSQLDMPEGVTLTALTHGSSDYDQAVVGIGKIKR
ncbi:MAG: 50S ribosomal protein L25/general stress protein Ctc [Hydrogenovibrio sp.]|nr:50S ribosomal protein L25/general stress protein Ctc [Hydrogenovibrio sp.]